MSDAEPLSPERFQALADAYGGVIPRWPDAVQAQALRQATEPRFAAILADALDLDLVLDQWVAPQPSSGLAEAILAGAPVRTVRPRSRVRLWWSGIGIATALAGVGTGAFAATAVIRADAVAPANTTAFGDLAAQDS